MLILLFNIVFLLEYAVVSGLQRYESLSSLIKHHDAESVLIRQLLLHAVTGGLYLQAS